LLRAEEEIMPEARLPERFRDLEPLAATWAMPTEAARHTRRLESSFDELQAFYDKLLPRIDDMLSYLSEFQVEALSPEGELLLNFALALAEIAPAVELFGQSEVPNGYDSRRFIARQGQ
jgi:hypothetical protein